jgi:hypothetical protein
MSIEKAASEILAYDILRTTMPLASRAVMASPQYKAIRRMYAEGRLAITDGLKKMAEAEAALGDLLTENGLQAVVQDFREARAEPKQEG